MGGQGVYHRSWLDIWHLGMVAVLLYTVYQSYTDMGIREETSTYACGIQHHLGVDKLYGSCTAFGINIHMSEQYLLPMARNTVTGQTVKTQDLDGLRYSLSQRALAESAADRCAAKMTARTGDTWRGFVREYTPRERT